MATDDATDATGEPTEESLGVVVPQTQGETVRRQLLDASLLRTDLQIRRDDDELILPVTDEVPDRETVKATFRVQDQGPSDYRDLLDLPDDVHSRLPSSYDVIGDVACFKLPDDLDGYEAMVGDALLEFTGARVACLDHGVTGPHRVRDLEVVAGDGDTETTHREHGVAIQVDPAKAYFSPRLATERRRLADLVQDGEVVVDAFAGVGPVSLVIARHADPKRIVAVEINPDAAQALRDNVEANHAGKIIDVIEDDAADILPDLAADRVIMNLPHDAASYLPKARQALQAGGWIHLYEILPEADVPARVDELEADGLTVERHRNVHHYSPRDEMVAFDCREGS